MKTASNSGPLLLVLLLAASISLLAQSPGTAQTASSTAANSSRSPEVASAIHPLRPAMSSLLITKIVTNKSDILTEQELRNAVSGYERRQVTQNELTQMVDDINRLYATKGFSTARAVLPPQTVQDGVVHVRLIESRVGKVIVQNNTHTRASYFLSRVSMTSGELLKPDKLQQQLAYFNGTNDLKMRAVLQPGEQFGSTDIVFQAEGPSDFEFTTFSDNAGRDTIGLYRAGATVTYKSLFGNRDPLTVNFLGANGTLMGGVGYSVPLGTRGTRFGGTFSYNAIALNGGVLGSTGMVGHSYDAALRLSHPVFVRTNQAFSGSLSAHYKSSSLSAEGFPLSHTQVRSLELSTEWQRFDTHGMWFANNMLSGGFENFNGGFVRYDGLVSRIVTLSPSVSAMFRGSGQVSAINPLVPIEQMQIGGATSVRGYPEAALIGDRAYAATAELDFPVLRNDWARKRLKMAAFVDGGAVFEEGLSGSGRPHDTKLLSTGFGFALKLSEHMSGRIDFGIPLRNKAGIPDVGIHFSVQSTFGFPHRRAVQKAGLNRTTGQD